MSSSQSQKFALVTKCWKKLHLEARRAHAEAGAPGQRIAKSLAEGRYKGRPSKLHEGHEPLLPLPGCVGARHSPLGTAMLWALLDNAGQKVDFCAALILSVLHHRHSARDPRDR